MLIEQSGTWYNGTQIKTDFRDKKQKVPLIIFLI